MIGTSDGKVSCGSIYEQSNSSNTTTTSVDNTNAYTNINLAPSKHIIRQYPIFNKLTSIHVNNTDDKLLLSGYTKECCIYDMETTQLVHKYDNIHDNHINISRFMHTSPHIFATSSFDKTVKLWDTREAREIKSTSSNASTKQSKSIYTITNKAGIVMMSFAPNDMFLLTAGTVL